MTTVVTAEQMAASRAARTVGPIPPTARLVATIEDHADPGSVTNDTVRHVVRFTWHDAGTDRTDGHAISTNRNRRLAERLVAAHEAGRIFDLSEAIVLRDVGGRTYVSLSCNVMGKYLNADLRRMGF